MMAFYTHLIDFFTGFEWWKLEPRPELITEGFARCLAEPGQRYVVYLPKGGATTVKLNEGDYTLRDDIPQTVQFTMEASKASGGSVRVTAPGDQDWVFLLERR